jgi:hypothetical protein
VRGAARGAAAQWMEKWTRPSFARVVQIQDFVGHLIKNVVYEYTRKQRYREKCVCIAPCIRCATGAWL